MEIRRIRSEEWQELKGLRLQALRDAPDAFGSTYEQEVADPDDEWRRWATAGAEDGRDCVVVAIDDGERWVGMAMGAEHREQPNVAYVFAMWVAPAARRKGIGLRLTEAVVAWGRAAGFPEIRVRVTEANEAAVSLYRRAGFADTGERMPLRQGSNVITMTMAQTLGS